MDTSLVITLQNYGFSEKESKVYLTILELGTSIASTIARRSEIKRVNVYSILDDMKQKGIVNETTKDDMKYYSVISPDILLVQLEQKYNSFKEKLPEIFALADKFCKDKTKIQYFEGVIGLRKVFDDFTNTTVSNKSFLGSIKEPKVHDILLDLAKEYVKKRVKNKIHFQRILSTTGEVDIKQEKKRDKEYFRETVVIRDLPHQIKADITLYGPNKVAFIMREETKPYAIVIYNEKMYESVLAIFDYIWISNKK